MAMLWRFEDSMCSMILNYGGAHAPVFCVQHQKRMEAERLRLAEEAELRKKMNIKKAKEEAERHHKVQFSI